MSIRSAQIFTGVSVLAMAAAGSVQAQAIYGGLGVSQNTPDFGATGSFQAAPLAISPGSTTAYNSLTATAGVLWGDTALRYGLEGQVSGASDIANLALRGIVSYDLGKVRVMGAAGVAALRETVVLRGGGTTTNTYTGAQFGLGVEFEATDHARIRLEGNRENLTGGRHMDTVSLGVLFDF